MKPDNLPSAPAAKPVGGQVFVSSDAQRSKMLTLTLEAPRFNGALVLHCQGKMVFRSEARSLSGLIAEVLPTAKRMVVNLAGIQSLDSDALGELVLTHLWAEAAGYTLKFACPSDAVRRLFESTNLVSVFDIYASVAEAISAMRHEEVMSA